MKPITLIKAIDDELKDTDRKEIILFLLATVDNGTTLFEIKKKLDPMVKLEKAAVR